jgi:hypothetical protein
MINSKIKHVQEQGCQAHTGTLHKFSGAAGHPMVMLHWRNEAAHEKRTKTPTTFNLLRSIWVFTGYTPYRDEVVG